MKVGICQFDIAWEDKEKNKSRILSVLGDSKLDIDWLIFPEMSLSGFSMNIEKSQLAPEDIDFFKNISISRSVYTTFGGVVDGNNRSITLDKKGNSVAEYSKIHLFSFAGEKNVYKPGETTLVFSLCGIRISPFICYDLRFSYLFWKTAALSDFFVVIANWPSSRIRHWKTLLAARAIENQSYIIGVNRIGKDQNTEYCGNSLVIDPLGNIVMDAGDGEGVFITEIDKKAGDEARKRFPFQKDRLE